VVGDYVAAHYFCSSLAVVLC